VHAKKEWGPIHDGELEAGKKFGAPNFMHYTGYVGIRKGKARGEG
jgi:hypothetical protein